MKIAITGTRGIPNLYGGFESFAEKFAPRMVERGHSMSVFNSSLNPFRGDNFKGVEIIRCYDPEDIIGTAGQFIYDLNCIIECRKRNFEIILQLGYTSSSVWSALLPAKSYVITNMDGLEWKRSKYSAAVQKFLKRAERKAVKSSDSLIADNPGIKDYLLHEYSVNAQLIPYGAELFSGPDDAALDEFRLKPYSYNLVIARFEPENNIETIIKGHLAATGNNVLLIVGNADKRYGARLKTLHQSAQIRFLGAIYDPVMLNQLRWFSNIYFHGHSVGGTNPSLLEAMAASALVCAHQNVFNAAILGNDGFYFNSANDISQLLERHIRKSDYQEFLSANTEKITRQYNWDKICSDYESLFMQKRTGSGTFGWRNDLSRL